MEKKKSIAGIDKKWLETKFAKTCACLMLISICTFFLILDVIYGGNIFLNKDNYELYLLSDITIIVCVTLIIILLISIYKKISSEKHLFKTKIFIEIIAECFIFIIKFICVIFAIVFCIYQNPNVFGKFGTDFMLYLTFLALPLDFIAIFFTSVALLSKIKEA